MRKVDCDYDDASSAFEALGRCPAGLDPILEETLPCGVAYHHAGLTILICKPDDLKRVAAILNDSCLSEDKNGMTHPILEVVAGGIVQTASDIHRYVRCTLLNSTKPFQDVVKSAQDSLRWLCHKNFLEWNEDTQLYSTTPLGRAAFGSSLTPEESLVVLDDLLRAREAFVIASDLHLVYLVTPINVEVQPNWELYYERFMELPALDQSVGNRVVVAEPFLMRMAHGNHLLSSEQTLRVSRWFYVTLMLARLVQVNYGNLMHGLMKENIHLNRKKYCRSCRCTNHTASRHLLKYCARLSQETRFFRRRQAYQLLFEILSAIPLV